MRSPSEEKNSSSICFLCKHGMVVCGHKPEQKFTGAVGSNGQPAVKLELVEVELAVCLKSGLMMGQPVTVDSAGKILSGQFSVSACQGYEHGPQKTLLSPLTSDEEIGRMQ